MINSYDEVILARIQAEDGQVGEISSITITFFNDLFIQVIKRIKKEFVVQNHLNIFEFFKSAFSLTHLYYKHNAEVDMNRVKEVEEAISKSYE